MQFTIGIPDAIWPEVRDAYALMNDFRSEKQADPTLTKRQFMKRSLRKHLRLLAIEARSVTAADVARSTGYTEVDMGAEE